MFGRNHSFRRHLVVIPVSIIFLLLGLASVIDSVNAKLPAKPSAAPPPAYPNVPYDFNGDGSSDIGRWHPTNTEFKVANGGGYLTYTVGTSSSVPAPGNFNGDSYTDAGTFSAGTWKYKTSTGGSETTVSFGQSGDIPVVGDYDNDGTDDIAVFRPSNSTWYVRESSTCNPTCNTASTAYGSAGDIPVPGDFDGDGETDLAVFRPSNGYWYVQKSGGGSISQPWGQSGDVPVQGDFDGDGLSDPAVFRPSTGYWYTADSGNSYSTYIAYQWGNWSDQPVPADYDGDGRTDFAIWRETTGGWHIITNNGEGGSYITATLGVPGDTAIPSAYTKQVGGTVSGYEMAGVRLDPDNATGGTDLYSRNFGWGTSLVGLPGRSGMDLSLGIGYNSLVWAKYGSVMYFDPDSSNVTPGFRFGFPVIEPIYYDSAKSKWAYMMVTPNGSRIEFRETTVGNTYETADSSYTQLVTSGNTNPNDPVEGISISVKTTDGTQMSYLWIAGSYRCTQIKDRNGNYITIANDSTLGRLNTVTDTLGRVVTVNYNNDGLPTTLQQTWRTNNGHSSGSNVTHTWATLSYTTKTVDTDFHSTNITGVYGPPDDTVLNVLDKITYADGSATKFDYNGYIQVKKVSTIAADSGSHVLNYVETNLASPSSQQQDCPRLGQTKTWAENFNSGSEVVVTNDAPTSATFTAHGGSESTSMVKVTMSNHPTSGFYTKLHFGASGYEEGLTIGTEDCTATNCTGADRKRWSWTDWTQDNTGVSYITNPRVVESKVGDGSSTKRTSVSYYSSGGANPYGLPELVKVYDTDLSTVLKTQKTVYNLSSDYTSRRIIGLPSESYLYQGTDTAGTLMSKLSYAYDEGSDSSLTSATQHDGTNYSTSLNYRGNLTSTTRCDASTSGPTTCYSGVTSSTAYNIAGSPISKTDPRGRVSTVSYSDVWNDSVSRTTYAYPTTVTDPGGFSATIKYRYDLGANVWAQSPTPAGGENNDGKTTSRTFSDTTGRIIKETIDNTGAYTEYEYNTNGTEMTSFTTLVDVYPSGVGSEDEVATLTVRDGAGRVLKTRTENPDSTGGYTGKKVTYDILGRITGETVPTEINSSWNPTGDDSAWLWNSKEYDWKGRVTRTIPSDSTGSDDKDTLISYDGCGCAGGQITTIKGPKVIGYDQGGTPKRRMQKVYEDILGRTYKSEVWDFYENSPSTPYSTTKTTFNGRDQATLIREYAGSDSSSTYQDTTMSYDGHGRLYQKHLPQWFNGTASYPRYTEYTYNADDTVATMTDPRGAGTTYTYENVSGTPKRPLLTKIEYTSPNQNVPDVTDVTFSYDDAGNRLQMTDGTGTLDYEYDELSRLKKETKDFADNFENGPGEYFLEYEYHLGGGLKSIEDVFDQKTTYPADKTGRLTSIGDATSATAYVSSISHRAFGGIKQMVINTENETTVSIAYDSALRPATYVADNDAVEGDIQNAAYTYGKDGLVSGVDNAAAPEFDQANAYDFAGRLKASTAGPLEQWLEYDAFSNLTQRQNEFYEYEDRFEAGYANNRKAWGIGDGYDYHDNSGNVVNTHFQPYVGLGNRPVVDDKKWTFDAAGRMTYFTQFTTAPPQTSDAKEVKQEITFDGDGRAVKEDNKWRDCETAEKVEDCTGEWLGEPFYYLISSVTGQRITHVQTGLNAGQAIYLGGTKIAGYWAYDESRRFTLTDPVTGSTAPMESDGTVYDSTRTELGAFGTSVPLFEPPAYPPRLDFESGYVGDSEYGCKDDPIDGMPCSLARLRQKYPIEWPTKTKEPIGIIAPKFKRKNPYSEPNSGPPTGLAMSSASGYTESYGFDMPTLPEETVTVNISDSFDGLSAEFGMSPPDACNTMVWRLQRAVDDNLEILGGPSNMTDHAKIDQLVSFIDQTFNNFHLGKTVKGEGAGPVSGRLSSKVTGPPFDGGESGFKPDYQDISDDPNFNDQTHHFARYFRGGIKGGPIEYILTTAHSSIDHAKDRALGNIAYSLGASLNKLRTGTEREIIDAGRRNIVKTTPIYETAATRFVRVRGIANTVRTAICN